MRVGFKLKPLRSKYYSTELIVWVGRNSWDKVGVPMRVSISGAGSCPSTREYERGYDPDEGMDHVESEEAYQLVKIIMEALRKHS